MRKYRRAGEIGQMMGEVDMAGGRDLAPVCHGRFQVL
jgi:hypothetical protein